MIKEIQVVFGQTGFKWGFVVNLYIEATGFVNLKNLIDFALFDADGIQVDICTVIGPASSCILQAFEVVCS